MSLLESFLWSLASPLDYTLFGDLPPSRVDSTEASPEGPVPSRSKPRGSIISLKRFPMLATMKLFREHYMELSILAADSFRMVNRLRSETVLLYDYTKVLLYSDPQKASMCVRSRVLPHFAQTSWPSLSLATHKLYVLCLERIETIDAHSYISCCLQIVRMLTAPEPERQAYWKCARAKAPTDSSEPMQFTLSELFPNTHYTLVLTDGNKVPLPPTQRVVCSVGTTVHLLCSLECPANVLDDDLRVAVQLEAMRLLEYDDSVVTHDLLVNEFEAHYTNGVLALLLPIKLTCAGDYNLKSIALMYGNLHFSLERSEDDADASVSQLQITDQVLFHVPPPDIGLDLEIAPPEDVHVCGLAMQLDTAPMPPRSTEMDRESETLNMTFKVRLRRPLDVADRESPFGSPMPLAMQGRSGLLARLVLHCDERDLPINPETDIFDAHRLLLRRRPSAVSTDALEFFRERSSPGLSPGVDLFTKRAVPTVSLFETTEDGESKTDISYDFIHSTQQLPEALLVAGNGGASVKLRVFGFPVRSNVLAFLVEAPSTTDTSTVLQNSSELIVTLPLLPPMLRQGGIVAVFSCHRGVDVCTQAKKVVLPFAAAFDCAYRFQHFKGRVFCSVCLTNKLRRLPLSILRAELRLDQATATCFTLVPDRSHNSALVNAKMRPGDVFTFLFELQPQMQESELCLSSTLSQITMVNTVQFVAEYCTWEAYSVLGSCIVDDAEKRHQVANTFTGAEVSFEPPDSLSYFNALFLLDHRPTPASVVTLSVLADDQRSLLDVSTNVNRVGSPVSFVAILEAAPSATIPWVEDQFCCYLRVVVTNQNDWFVCGTSRKRVLLPRRQRATFHMQLVPLRDGPLPMPTISLEDTDESATPLPVNVTLCRTSVVIHPAIA